jgi:hypothetical protein
VEWGWLSAKEQVPKGDDAGGYLDGRGPFRGFFRDDSVGMAWRESGLKALPCGVILARNFVDLRGHGTIRCGFWNGLLKSEKGLFTGAAMDTYWELD